MHGGAGDIGQLSGGKAIANPLARFRRLGGQNPRKSRAKSLAGPEQESKSPSHHATLDASFDRDNPNDLRPIQTSPSSYSGTLADTVADDDCPSASNSRSVSESRR